MPNRELSRIHLLKVLDYCRCILRVRQQPSRVVNQLLSPKQARKPSRHRGAPRIPVCELLIF